MERFLMDKLVIWKNNPKRKPLILQGARQTGKTWLLKEFGNRYYKSVRYLLFDQNEELSRIFSNPSDISFIIRSLAAFYGLIENPADTLFIFDEIQQCPAAMTSLKYFSELAPEYHIAAAGSLLGISEHSSYAFPVGKVDFINLFPMSFTEFMLALGEEPIAEAIEKEDYRLLAIREKDLNLLLKQYMYVGGMPEAVEAFSQSGRMNYRSVRKIQENILKSYELDFSKHIADKKERKHVEIIWDSIPSQLAKENRKFVFSALQGSHRAVDYENALKWLSDAGLITIIRRLKTQKIPTSAYEEKSIFKIYMLDTGLLSALSGISAEAIISDTALLVEFKGALAEQYVCQELKTQEELHIHYYTNDNSTSEVEFIVDNGTAIVPVEVKSGINVRARSLMAYTSRFQPDLAIRLSLKGYEEQDEKNLISLPLYAVGNVSGIIRRKISQM